ncbi:hypothetical protein G6F59_018036 [Rhizopus arrhizus]|nr:hypothetical protein G6F59_018036 [Rhizopus arrhizus]
MLDPCPKEPSHAHRVQGRQPVRRPPGHPRTGRRRHPRLRVWRAAAGWHWRAAIVLRTAGRHPGCGAAAGRGHRGLAGLGPRAGRPHFR